MTAALGLLETTGLTPAMVAIDAMVKAAAVGVFQLELNDLSGVCVKISGALADVQTALAAGRTVAEQLRGRPVMSVLTNVSPEALPAIRSQAEFSPLIQQAVVFDGDASGPMNSVAPLNQMPQRIPMNQETPMALGFIETQGLDRK